MPNVMTQFERGAVGNQCVACCDGLRVYGLDALTCGRKDLAIDSCRGYLMVITGGHVKLIAGDSSISNELGCNRWLLNRGNHPQSWGVTARDAAGIVMMWQKEYLDNILPGTDECQHCANSGGTCLQGYCCGKACLLAASIRHLLKSTEAASALLLASRAYELFYCVMQQLAQHTQGCASRLCAKRRDIEAVYAVARYLSAHPGEPHSLAALSRQHGLNEFKLKNLFRDYLGDTVFGYLRKRRMETAWELLRTGQYTVMEVACQVGYSNPSHFARAFRDIHGINPGNC